VRLAQADPGALSPTARWQIALRYLNEQAA